MKYRLLPICFSFFTLAFFSAFSQEAGWPKTFNTNGSIAKLYEPQPQSYQGNILKIKAAISLLRADKTDPVFGVLWADVTVDNNQDKNLIWQDATVTNIKFPGEASDAELNQLSDDLQKQVSSWNISIAKDELTAKLQNSDKELKLSGNLNNTPPKIIYRQTPSILVLIDGQPQLTKNTNWGVEQVSNTPFTIVKDADQLYYLYGNKSWFRASSITGPWSKADRLPSHLDKMDTDVRARDTSKASSNNSPSQIIVSTEPAELIQSNGEANFSPIDGTNLLYLSNSVNDVFLDVNSQQYYALISGRWYKTANLNNSWSYTASDKLPADFAKIPEGSPKDVVLPNVAGTNAANESVMEAQVPQTAKVDRRNAKASVTYDGEPQFEQIEGTHLRYAINTPGTVLNLKGRYYLVDNGVWFESYSATGPWTVATSRPAEVENIPPSYPVYNSKYVYVYDATPDYVYMGYTPGYLGNYIYGPTIVYGTGYYYRPWRGRYYYPHASTWGYNMRYNPWTGWNFGLDYWGGWFSFGIGSYYDSYWGGWWGPQIYRPCYFRPYSYNYGYYGRNVYVNNYTIVNNYRSNNLYRNRGYVVTRDRPGFYNVRSNGRSTPYNANNYGRFNNGRAMTGAGGNNYNGGGNRFQDQRPGSQMTDRQGNRSYQPNNQPGRLNDRSGVPGNNNATGRVAGSVNGQPNSNPRLYTPSNSGDNGNSNRPPRPAIDRSANSGNPAVTQRPQFNNNRTDMQDRQYNPGNSSPRAQQDRPMRLAQDRTFNGPVNSPRPQMERPSGTMQNRQSAPAQSAPAARPSGGQSGRGGGGGGRPEHSSQGRGNH